MSLQLYYKCYLLIYVVAVAAILVIGLRNLSKEFENIAFNHAFPYGDHSLTNLS